MQKPELPEPSIPAFTVQEQRVRALYTADQLAAAVAAAAVKEREEARKQYQSEIEKWKAEAVTAEKWKSLVLSKDGDGRTVQAIEQEAIAKEREACAKVCDELAEKYANAIWLGTEEFVCVKLSEKIRARSNK